MEKRLQKEAFQTTREATVALKGAMLLRYTKDQKLQISKAPHSDISWKYHAHQTFVGHFCPGNKMLLLYSDGKSNTAEFVAWFPSEETAQQRLHTEAFRAEKKVGTDLGKTKSDRSSLTSKKPKVSQELPKATPAFASFQDRLRTSGIPTTAIAEKMPGDREPGAPEAARKEIKNARSTGTQPSSSKSGFSSTICGGPAGAPEPSKMFQKGVESCDRFPGHKSQAAPLTPIRMSEDDFYPDDDDFVFTTLKAPYAKETEEHIFIPSPDDYAFNSLTSHETVGGWHSQNSIVSNLAVRISLDESSHTPAEVESMHKEARSQQQNGGFLPDEIYTPSDSVLFQRKALLATPITLDNQPAKDLTTILFPTEVFRPSGAPVGQIARSSTVLSCLQSYARKLDGVPGVVMDNKGPVSYVSNYVLPRKYSSDSVLANQNPPRFKDPVEWRTTDMPIQEEFIIPTKRTQEKDFALKNPPRVNRNAICMRDNVSPWFFSLAGPDKVLLDDRYPGIFADSDAIELHRKFLAGKILTETYAWYLMCRMLGGGPGLVRLTTLYEMKRAMKESQRQYGFYEETLGKHFFSAVAASIKSKIQSMMKGAPVTAESTSRLPEVPSCLPTFFCRKMNSWMHDFRLRDEASKSEGPRGKSPVNNIGSDEDD